MDRKKKLKSSNNEKGQRQSVAYLHVLDVRCSDGTSAVPLLACKELQRIEATAHVAATLLRQRHECAPGNFDALGGTHSRQACSQLVSLRGHSCLVRLHQ